MNLPRRTFLKGLFATGSAMALGTSVLPQSVMADWQTAIEKKEATEAKDALFDGAKITEITDKNLIAIKTPKMAENGQVVPIEVTANLEKLESITILVEKNTTPLVAQFNFPDPENALGWVKTRIKMGKTSDVVAIVKANGQLYAARQEVTVTIGGCGG